MEGWILTLTIGVVVFALSCRNLWQAYRTESIIYRPDIWHREKNPVMFWAVVALSGLFAIGTAALLVAQREEIWIGLIGLIK